MALAMIEAAEADGRLAAALAGYSPPLEIRLRAVPFIKLRTS
jgi:hypothetical protein